MSPTETELGCASAIDAVLAERVRQDEKWGEQNQEPEIWLTILLEEIGEFSERVLERRFGGHSMHSERPCGQCGDLDGCHVPANLRMELIQVAAVALAMLECCDRNNWPMTHPELAQTEAE